MIRAILPLVLLLAACANTRPSASKTTLRFDGTAAGSAAPGVLAATGEWKVAEGGVLAQLASSPDAAFNVALVEGTSLEDLDLSVRLRAREGKVDRGGGLIWRARDANNYYVARFNPLEDNFRVYHVKDGKRTELESADAKLDPAAWHTVRVRMVADRIECFLDGERLLDVIDATFPLAGMVGLWTKADARTEFDDLVAAAVRADEP